MLESEQRKSQTEVAPIRRSGQSPCQAAATAEHLQTIHMSSLLRTLLDFIPFPPFFLVLGPKVKVTPNALCDSGFDNSQPIRFKYYDLTIKQQNDQNWAL